MASHLRRKPNHPDVFTPIQEAKEFSFCVIGDTPYSAMEACLLPFSVGKRDPYKYPYGIEAEQCDFLVHL